MYYSAACTHHTIAQAAIARRDYATAAVSHTVHSKATPCLTVAGGRCGCNDSCNGTPNRIAPERFSKLAPFIIFAMTFSRMSPLHSGHSMQTKRNESRALRPNAELFTAAQH
jgi:hypothetical protein